MTNRLRASDQTSTDKGITPRDRSLMAAAPQLLDICQKALANGLTTVLRVQMQRAVYRANGVEAEDV